MLTNFSLQERAKGHGPALNQDELLDLLMELEDWRKVADDAGADTPDHLQAVIDGLNADQANPDHADYDDLKEFFEDCQQLIGYSNPWESTADQAKAMLEELHEMDRELGSE